MIRLPDPLSANDYWRSRVVSRRGKNGQLVHMASVYKTTPARQYQALVAMTARLVFKKVRNPTRVKVRVHWFRQGTGDLDNRLKVVFDALIGVGYDSDNQISHIEATRSQVKPPTEPSVVVAIEETKEFVPAWVEDFQAQEAANAV